MILQFGILMAFLALGELVVWLTGVPIPSSIIGMLLLTVALHYKIVRLRWVDTLASFLVHNLGFFFVPAGVGLIASLGLVSNELIPIVGASVGSTIIIIAVTGQTHQLVRKAMGHRRHAKKNETSNDNILEK